MYVRVFVLSSSSFPLCPIPSPLCCAPLWLCVRACVPACACVRVAGIDPNEGFVEQLELLSKGASAQALVDAADRRDTGEGRREKARVTKQSRAKDRDRKNRGGYDD